MRLRERIHRHILTVLAALLALASQVAAQPRGCLATDIAFYTLENRYGETPAYVGNVRGHPVHLLVNPRTGTWTFVVTHNNLTCIIAYGTDWADAPPLPPNG